MPTVAIALCRAGFEAEAAADLGAIAAHARTPVDAKVEPGSACVIARIEHADASAWRRAVHAHPPIFVRSLWTGTGPHTIAPPRSAGRPDRIAPLAAAFAELASMPGHRAPWLPPWIEYADTNEGKALSTLARSLDARLAGALRERGSAVITVTHDHRMIEGFDAVYHLDDGRLSKLERETADAAHG